jgi:hypothetical protein
MFKVQETKGKTELVFETEVESKRRSVLETEGKKELHFKKEIEIKFLMCKRRRGR